MEKSNETSSSSVSQTEVDTSSGVTSETLYVQKFRGGELIYSSNKEYETIESVDCNFAQEIELPAVSRTTSPQPSTSKTLTKAEKMARVKRTLNRKQKPIFLKIWIYSSIGR